MSEGQEGGKVIGWEFEQEIKEAREIHANWKANRLLHKATGSSAILFGAVAINKLTPVIEHLKEGIPGRTASVESLKNIIGQIDDPETIVAAAVAAGLCGIASYASHKLTQVAE